jgi:murein DD-endopeptidase
MRTFMGRQRDWRRSVFAVRTIAGIALMLAATPGAFEAQLPPSVELRVPKPPTVGAAEDGSFIAYEVHVTNLGMTPLTLTRVEVTSGDAARRPIYSLSDSTLVQSVARPGVTIAPTERLRIGGGLRAVIFVWAPIDAQAVPISVRNRVTVTTGTGDSVQVHVLDAPEVPVTTTAVVIGPPLRGGPWLAGNGPSNRSGHRRALIALGGTPAIAQRFAIDFVKMNDGNSTFTGDRLKNESYLAEGADALVVADGRVVAVKDGIPENVPGVNSRAVPITIETIGGNHVILDIGGGLYAFYAHLKPGSLRVKEGDRVKRGQVLGAVGNSGNSTEPHLHFHISDANSPLGSDGVPYAFDSFEIVGTCQSFTACTRTGSQPRTKRIPLDRALIRFR